ncbi:YczE/YyaS/YitT family protein [Anaerotignum sp.]
MKSRKILMSICGVMIGAVSVGFFKLAALGVDPFQTFMCGINQMIPISFGTLYVIVNAVLLLFALIFDRHYIGIATFINLFLLGYVVEFTHQTLLGIFPDASLMIRITSLVFGFVALCFGSSVYMTADLGVSTYDAVALIMANKWKLGKFKYIRIATDAVCVVLGITLFLLGDGKISAIPTFVGLGTILAASSMGPLIDFFNRKVSIPFLEKAKK